MPRSFLIRKILGLDDDDNNIAVGVKEANKPMNEVLTNDIVTNVFPRDQPARITKIGHINGRNLILPFAQKPPLLMPFKSYCEECKYCKSEYPLYYDERQVLSLEKQRMNYSSAQPLYFSGKKQPESYDVPNVVEKKDHYDTQKHIDNQCGFCGMEFGRSSDLQRHLLIHSKTKPYTCSVCDRGFTWFGNFQKHMLTHGEQKTAIHPVLQISKMKEEDLVIKDGKSFKCRLCLKLFTRMSGLRTHIRMHTGQRPFKCAECSFAFTTSRALKMHMRIHTGERPYKCEECPKAFTRRDELQAHIYMHKGEKPYKCSECPSAFIRYGHLQRHKLIHSNDKPYKCKYCSKSFTQYRNLQTHTYKHTGERPFKCSYCSKGFTQYGTLQAHERIHTGDKPFSCKECDKSFITSSHLRWHVKRHHARQDL